MPVLLQQGQPGPVGAGDGLDRELGHSGQRLAELHLAGRQLRQRGQAEAKIGVLAGCLCLDSWHGHGVL